MAMHPRAFLFAACGVVVAIALAIAAEAQMETFLHPSELESGFQDRELVSGNIVYLTSFLAALAIAAAGLVLGKSPWPSRLLGSGILFVAGYILIGLVQTGMFNYNAIDLTRSATFTISPIFANLEANPGVFLGPIALVALAALSFQAGGGLLMAPRRQRAVPAPAIATRIYVGLVALATPFLIIATVGGIRLLVQLPSGQAGATPYFVLLPIAILAAIGILVTSSLKAAHLAAFSRNGRLAPVSDEAWQAIRKAEWVLFGVLLGVSMLGSMLEPLELASLSAGRVFGLTTRAFLQSYLALALVAIPLMGFHRTGLRVFTTHDGHTRTLESSGVHPALVAYWIGLGLAAAGALAASWAGGALWGWLAATLPLAVVSILWMDHRDSLVLALLAALVLWAIGNTVSGAFELRSDQQLSFDMHPGVLALFRAAAVLLVAWAVAAAARQSPAEMRQAFRVPLTIALGAVVSLIVFLELPFTAWVLRDQGSEYVGLGTVVASQDAAVQTVMHGLAVLSAFAASMIIARLHRPEWFERPGAPVPELAKVAASA